MTQLPFADLQRLTASPSLDGQQQRAVLDTMFMPREVVVSGTSYTISESDRGAVLRFTSGSTVTVTLPASLASGFLFSFVQYGAGALAFSGTTKGGTGSAGQYTMGSCWLMSTGEWLVVGGA